MKCRCMDTYVRTLFTIILLEIFQFVYALKFLILRCVASEWNKRSPLYYIQRAQNVLKILEEP